MAVETEAVDTEAPLRVKAFDRLNAAISELEHVLAAHFGGRSHSVEVDKETALHFGRFGDGWRLFVGKPGGSAHQELVKAPWQVRIRAASKVDELIRQLDLLARQDVQDILNAAAVYEKASLALAEKDDD